MIRLLIADALTEAMAQARNSGQLQLAVLPEFSVDRPENSAFGDFSLTLPMIVSGLVNLPPRQVAQVLLDHLQLPERFLQRAEVAGPGFINLYLQPTWMHEMVQQILQSGAGYGRVNLGKGRRVLVEFVSANPNGPLGIGHGRGAVIGDVLCNVLEAAGYQVTREFYVNDAATTTQMRRFGESLVVRYLQLLGERIDMPEEGSQGEYITDFARRIVHGEGERYLHIPTAERLELFTALGQEAMLRQQHDLLADFGVHFDNWFRESTLLNGAVDDAVRELTTRGEIITTEGAIWLASSRHGDDGNHPLVRSNGMPTYLATDVAYHRQKFARGYDTLIDVWGADHHGYIARTKAAMAALGFSPERLQVIVYQPVRLRRNGAYVVAGKHKGESIALVELLAQLGRDAARFFLLLQRADHELDIDLELAARRVPENPVYFVRSAHARIAGILRSAHEAGLAMPDSATVDFTLLLHEQEIVLMRRLADFAEEVTTAAELCEPHRLTRYAWELARDFHAFYDVCPVLKAETPSPLRDARLLLVSAAKITLHNVLTLLGVSAPEKME